MLPSLAKDKFQLESGEARHEESPEEFWIPDRSVRESCSPGQLVKLVFSMQPRSRSQPLVVERMWVEITERTESGYVGKLDNDPSGDVFVEDGAIVHFLPEHIIQVYAENDT